MTNWYQYDLNNYINEELKRLTLQMNTQVLNNENIDQENIDNILKQLNNLIGLKTLKEEIKNLIDFLNIQKKRQQLGLPRTPITLHLVFCG